MYTITEGPVARRRALSIDDFSEHFIEICAAMQAQGRAWAFAFLLYDFSHPHLRHLIGDDYYWDDLDQLSGRDLSIFSFHCPPLQIKPRQSRSWLLELGMASIATVVDSRDPVSPELIWRYFDGADVTPPCVLFFQVADQRIVDSLSIRLRKETIEEAHKELRSVLKAAVDALANLNPEYDPDQQDVFNLLKRAVTDKRHVTNALAIAKPLAGVVQAGTLLDFVLRLIR